MITKKTIKVPLYPCKLQVVIFDDKHEVEYFGEYLDDITNGFCDYFKDGFIRISVKSDSGVGAISHESHHAKSYVWKHIDYKPQADNDEVDAYLLSWIVKQVTKLYYKHKEKENGNRKETKDNKKVNEG